MPSQRPVPAMQHDSHLKHPDPREYSDCCHVIGLAMQQGAALLKISGTYEKDNFNSQCNIPICSHAGVFTGVLSGELLPFSSRA